MDDVILRRITILGIVFVSSIIALGIIGVALFYPMITGVMPPDILKDWGGLIIGFYFGTFANVLQGWLGRTRSSVDRKGVNDGKHADEM